MKACIVTLIALTLALSLHADFGNEIRLPWILTSANGHFLFKMVAIKLGVKTNKVIEEGKPYGVAYEINTEGELEEIWRVEGWHASEAYLANDGQHLVRIGTWPVDQKGHTDLLIAFYDRGKLLKGYQVRELIKKPELLENSVSHYQWRPESQTKPNGLEGNVFHLALVDKTTYRFDIISGKILETGVDTGARSRIEISQQEAAEDEQKGRAMYEVSDFRKAYDEHFILSEPEAVRGWSSNTPHIKGSSWRGTFLTRKHHAAHCEVNAALPVNDYSTIKNSITSQEIDAAFEKALAHPLVKQRIASGTVKRLRLLITHDRLHWNTEHLRELLQKTTGAQPKTDDPMRSWADFVLNADEANTAMFYLDVDTGEVVLEPALPSGAPPPPPGPVPQPSPVPRK